MQFVRSWLAPPSITILVVGLLTTLAHAQELGDASKGRAFALSICAECHAVLPSQLTSPRIGVATFKTIANTPGMTDRALVVWLRTSHPTMPNLLIAPEDTDNLIAYFASLRDK
jgi:mono/diheme cytochrome c family protein